MIESTSTLDEVKALIEEWIVGDKTQTAADISTIRAQITREQQMMEAIKAVPPQEYPALLPWLDVIHYRLLQALSAAHPKEAAELLVAEAEAGRRTWIVRFQQLETYGEMEGIRGHLRSHVDRLKKIAKGLEASGEFEARDFTKLAKSLGGLSAADVKKLRAGLRAGKDTAANAFIDACTPSPDPKIKDLIPDALAYVRTASERSSAWESVIYHLEQLSETHDVDPEVFFEILRESPNSNESESALGALKHAAKRRLAAGDQAGHDAIMTRLT